MASSRMREAGGRRVGQGRIYRGMFVEWAICPWGVNLPKKTAPTCSQVGAG